MVCTPLPYRRFADETLDSLLPFERRPASEWIPENVMFPAISASTPTLYDLADYPWVRGWIEAFEDPNIRTISLRCATQVGKTAFETAVLAYVAANAPCPTLVAGPDQNIIKSVSTNKLYPVFRASPEIARLLPPEHRQKDLEIDLLNMKVFFGWSGSPATLGEKSCKFIVKQELDKWSQKSSAEADPSELADERKKDFVGWKILQDSTPTITGLSRIDNAIDESDDRRYYIPCPYCGEYQELRWEQINLPHDKNGRLASPSVCRRETYYPCEKCGSRIEDHHKLASMRRGVWLRRGEGITTRGEIYIDDSEAFRECDHAGFTLSTLYSAKITWGEIGEKWAKCQGNAEAIQNFVNSWLARSWSPKDRIATTEMVLRRRCIEEGATYRQDECPRLPIAVMGCFDVQKASIWYTVSAWCEGRRQFILRYGNIPGSLEACLQIARMRFKTSDHKDEFGVTHLFMDSQYRKNEVFKFCKRYGFIPTVGHGSKVHSLKWGCQSDGLQVLHIHPDPFKEDLVRAIMRPGDPDDKESWRLFETADTEFASHLTAESFQRKFNKTSGRVTCGWHKDRYDNHWFDCCTMSFAAARALEIAGWNLYESKQVRPLPVKTQKRGIVPYSSADLVKDLEE